MKAALMKAALVTCSLAIAAVVVELTIRLAMPQTTGPSIFEPGPEGFSQLKHNFDAHLVGPEYDIDIHLNSRGLRDVEREYVKPAGVSRVLVVGDSFTMGAGVSVDQTYVKQLERRLNRGGGSTRYDVINAGVQNWGTGEQLVLLQKEWLRYQPDVVLLSFQHTDFTDNIQHGVWGLHDGQLRRLPIRRSDPPGSAVSHVWGYKWTINHSQAANYVRNGFFRLLYASESSSRSDELALSGSPDAANATYAWDLTDRLLAETQRVVVEREIPFLMAFIPSREEVDAYSQDGSRGPIEAFLTRFAASHGVPLLTLVPALAGGGRIQDLYFPKDGHWTPKAHEIAAAQLVPFLEHSR